jgi:hypothetical protein
MKKTYQIPATKIVNIQTVKMIATSGFDQALGGEGGSGSNALGRRGGSIWDDEEEY